MLIAKFVVSFSIYALVLLRAVRGEYIGVKQAYFGNSM